MKKSSFDKHAMLAEIQAKDLFRTDDHGIFEFNESSKVWNRSPKKLAEKVLLKHYLPSDRNATGFRYDPEKREKLFSVCKEICDALFTDPVFRLPECKLDTFTLPLTGGKNLNLKTLKLGTFGKSDFVTWAANFSFNEKAAWNDAPNFKRYVKLSLGIDLDLTELPPDKADKLTLICQILTYLVSNLTGAKKAFILLGPANCGKSRLLNFVKRFIGESNFSPLRFSDLGDRFRTSMLLYTNYILNDELGKDIDNLDLIKKVVSGEEIVAEEKNKPSFVLKPSIKVAFATNILPMPREMDPGGAFLQRLQILKFSESIDRKDWDLDLDAKLWEERDAIMSIAIRKSVEFVNSNFQFTDDPEALSIVLNYSLETNSVKAFVSDETYVIRDSAEAIHVRKLYDTYKLFCAENCIRAVSDRVFSGQLMDLGFTKTRKRLPGDKNPRFVILGLKLLLKVDANV